jgi:hypothetical protein
MDHAPAPAVAALSGIAMLAGGLAPYREITRVRPAPAP